jgi:rubrerythrin
MKDTDYLINLIENSHATKKPETDIECLRSAIIAEYDAVNMYENFASKCKNDLAKKVFLDIANEEKQHIGEFEKLAEKIDPDFVKMRNKGRLEVEDM